MIVSSTNRDGSNTLKVSRIYEKLLKELNADCEILDLCDLPSNILSAELYEKKSESYLQFINQIITPNKAFLFVVPEYNGSFPGVLKVFLDSVPPKEWNNKHACLVGVSDGRAGNLRGMDHLNGVLQYLKMHVFHNKLPISLIAKIMTSEGNFIEENQLNVCRQQIEGFLNWVKA